MLFFFIVTFTRIWNALLLHYCWPTTTTTAATTTTTSARATTTTQKSEKNAFYILGQKSSIVWKKNRSWVNPIKLFSTYNEDFPVFVIKLEHFKVQTIFSYLTKQSSLTTKVGKWSKRKFDKIYPWLRKKAIIVLPISSFRLTFEKCWNCLFT